MEDTKIVEQEDIILEGNPQAVAEGSDQQQTQGQPAAQPAKTFTQEEVDGMMAGRLARERSKFEQNIKREYGPLMDVLTAGTGKTSPREIADHLRTAVFIASDYGMIKPSNTDQGYILRRLIRRAIRHAKKLNIDVFSDWEEKIAKVIVIIT